VKLDRAAAWEEIRAISGNLESPLRCWILRPKQK